MVKEKYTGSLHKMVVTSDRDHLEMNNRKFGYNKQTLLNNTREKVKELYRGARTFPKIPK